MRKLILKMLVLLMAVCLTFGVSVTALAAGWENGEASRAGVIRVCQIDDYGTLYGFGTGFFIGQEGEPVEYIVTNAHVAGEVSNSDEENASYEKSFDKVTIVFDTLGSSSTQTAEVVTVFSDVDLAILKLDSPTTMRQALGLMSASEVDISEQVYAIGFPDVGDEDSALDPSLREFKSTPGDTTVNSGTVSNQQKVLQGENYLQIDATINAGNSGGPLCSEEGYVVGINSMTAVYGNDTNYALYVDYAMDWLDQNGIAYQKASRADATLTALSTGDEATGEPDVTGSGADNNDRNPIYLYAAITCAVVALASVILIIVLKHKAGHGGELTDDDDPVLSAIGWICVSCGTKNDGMFCEHCGLPKPGVDDCVDTGGDTRDKKIPPPETWICANCGNENHIMHDRCECCDSSRYAAPPRSEWTCNCGQVNTGRDCTRCGAEKGSDSAGYRPGRIGSYRSESTLGSTGSDGTGELRKKVNTSGATPVTRYVPGELKSKVKIGNSAGQPHEPDPLFKRLDSDDF